MKFSSLLALTLITLLASSCARHSIERNSTAMRHVGVDSTNKKLGKGVYAIIERNSSSYHIIGNNHRETQDKLYRKLALNAAKLTLKKGYDRFVVFKDVKDDEELQNAIERNKVRELYLKRIKQKSSYIGKARILVKSRRGGIILSNDMFAVIVMLKGGRIGYSARKVKRGIINRRPTPSQVNKLLEHLLGPPPKTPYVKLYGTKKK